METGAFVPESEVKASLRSQEARSGILIARAACGYAGCGGTCVRCVRSWAVHDVSCACLNEGRVGEVLALWGMEVGVWAGWDVSMRVSRVCGMKCVGRVTVATGGMDLVC